MRMANWSELQHDLLVLIGKRLNLIEDYLNFASVCKSWRSTATKANFNSVLPRVPWLMLAEEEDTIDGSSWRKFFSFYIGKIFNKRIQNVSDGKPCRKFVSLYNGMILKKRIPKASGKRCMESMGWLIIVGNDDDGEISLLHPFSGVQIELPHHQNSVEEFDEYDVHVTIHPRTFVHKAVLSASPSQTSDYIVVIIEGRNCFKNYLSFWRPGDLKWTRIERDSYLDDPCEGHRDVVYFNGKFYSVDWQGQVLVCDVTDANPKAQRVAQVPQRQSEDGFYIFESVGSLFVVARYGGLCQLAYDDDPVPLVPRFDKPFDFQVRYFQVYKVDLEAGKLMETKELGDRALFLGVNASLSVQASQFPGVQRNCIYFTNDIDETWGKYVQGGGVFNLADGTFDPHYECLSLNRCTPPIWVTPTLY